MKKYFKLLKTINRKNFRYILKSMIKIHKYLGGSFYEQNNALFLKINKYGLTFNIRSSYDIGSIFEIFYEKIYAFDSKNDHIVLDIGANIGDTALFFSGYDNVKRVYAFEPFKPTYNQAVENCDLNKNISQKIILNNFGVSDKNEKIDLPYDSRFTGVMSVENNAYRAGSMRQIESIETKSIDYIFKEIILQEDKKYKVVLKSDCEGSEYKIFDVMDKNNLFENVDVVMLEYHDKGAKPLLNILEKNNFISFLSKEFGTTGMIYSIRQK